MLERRFFIAFNVVAPWEENEPKGRYIEKEKRHLTIAFLGSLNIEIIEKLTSSIKAPDFIAPCGIFDKVLALPFLSPNVIAYRAQIHEEETIKNYQKELNNILKENAIFIKSEKFLSHVSLCRKPFVIKEWKKNFSKLPFYLSELILYESLGNSKYSPFWKKDLVLPFVELEHTADIAFKIRGKNFSSLYTNAFTALCFKFPKFTSFFVKKTPISLDDVIINLNELIALLDIAIGSPFKAVSFQSKIKEEKNYLEWEMVVDV